MVESQSVWVHKAALQTFLEQNEGKYFVLVTAGGTSVPLEKNTVRSVENFSTGTRGALSTEYFLKYSDNIRVIYFHRKTNCKMPFLVKLTVDSIVNQVTDEHNDQAADLILKQSDTTK